MKECQRDVDKRRGKRSDSLLFLEDVPWKDGSDMGAVSRQNQSANGENHVRRHMMRRIKRLSLCRYFYIFPLDLLLSLNV